MIIEYKKGAELDRKDMAEFVSNCMGDDNRHGFEPYMPNEGDDTFWTVDMGNDWKVKFFDDNLRVMEIYHRYHVKEAIEALATWVAYKTGGEVLKEKE